MIEKWIQFAIDNEYIEKCYFELDNENYVDFYLRWNPETWIDDEVITTINLYELITSKPFIEAVARGVLNKNRWKKVENFLWGLWYFSKDDSIIEELIDEITIKQAIAIRDNKLPAFIGNLLWE